MLVENTYKKGDVITAKLVNGDELVGRIEEIHDDRYLIKKPMMCVMLDKGVGLVPYMVSLNPEGSVNIGKIHILSIALTYKPVADHYITTTTGLKLN